MKKYRIKFQRKEIINFGSTEITNSLFLERERESQGMVRMKHKVRNKFKMNYTNNSTVCYKTWQYIHEPGADQTVLQIAFITTALLIVTSNGVLLRRLLSKKKNTRADRPFILLSLSDVGIEAFTVTLLSLQTFHLFSLYS